MAFQACQPGGGAREAARQVGRWQHERIGRDQLYREMRPERRGELGGRVVAHRKLRRRLVRPAGHARLHPAVTPSPRRLVGAQPQQTPADLPGAPAAHDGAEESPPRRHQSSQCLSYLGQVRLAVQRTEIAVRPCECPRFITHALFERCGRSCQPGETLNCLAATRRLLGLCDHRGRNIGRDDRVAHFCEPPRHLAGAATDLEQPAAPRKQGAQSGEGIIFQPGHDWIRGVLRIVIRGGPIEGSRHLRVVIVTVRAHAGLPAGSANVCAHSAQPIQASRRPCWLNHG